MARLLVGDKKCVFNANHTSKSDLATDLKLPVGTQCIIEHCPQGEVFEVEPWMIRPAPRQIRPLPR